MQEPRVHLEIGSRLENVELVQIAVEAALQQLQVSEELSHRIGTAVREAVANAIKHGNGLDPGKHVEVDLGFEDDEMIIHVRDEGGGFDPGAVPDPLNPENLLRPNGRGILIMKQFMDEVDYCYTDSCGTQLTMRKRLALSRDASHRQDKEAE